MIILFFVPVSGMVKLVLYVIPYVTVGEEIVRKAVKGILNRQMLDENLLMTIATIGAFALGAYEEIKHGEGSYAEAVAVMLFYQIGEFFQSYAVGKSRKNIAELMDIRPDYANVEKDGEIVKIDPDEVMPGSYIIVNPGEKVPIDGIVEEGASSLNTAALTGESAPRDISMGDSVPSGCINISGRIKLKTTKEFGESTASKILELVENASSRKSKSEAFITKFARVYTPAVVVAAIALALSLPLIRMTMNMHPDWGTWVYRALTFLVASCPCALVISVPLSFFAGLGGAGNRGILIKGSNYIESLAQVKTVVFDKTGTLTKGTFEVKSLHYNSISDEELLKLTALAESASSHPISKSIVEAYGKKLDFSLVKEIEEISGKGVIATVEGMKVAAGNISLMSDIGVSPILCAEHGTIIHVAIDGEYAGHIHISDSVKPTSADAVKALVRDGVSDVVMLTGDEDKVAEAISKQLGITTYFSKLLPADKVSKVEELLLKKQSGKSLAFVGDGINDAPVLTRSDVGIAMGALGSDAAIEAADVVLMDDDPLNVSKAVRIAKKCMRIVHENIWFAIGIKLVCLLLVALGFANMWLAIFADVGVMVLAVLNAVRALFVKNI